MTARGRVAVTGSATRLVALGVAFALLASVVVGVAVSLALAGWDVTQFHHTREASLLLVAPAAGLLVVAYLLVAAGVAAGAEP